MFAGVRHLMNFPPAVVDQGERRLKGKPSVNPFGLSKVGGICWTLQAFDSPPPISTKPLFLETGVRSKTAMLSIVSRGRAPKLQPNPGYSLVAPRPFESKVNPRAPALKLATLHAPLIPRRKAERTPQEKLGQQPPGTNTLLWYQETSQKQAWFGVVEWPGRFGGKKWARSSMLGKWTNHATTVQQKVARVLHIFFHWRASVVSLLVFALAWRVLRSSPRETLRSGQGALSGVFNFLGNLTGGFWAASLRLCTVRRTFFFSCLSQIVEN